MYKVHSFETREALRYALITWCTGDKKARNKLKQKYGLIKEWNVSKIK